MHILLMIRSEVADEYNGISKNKRIWMERDYRLAIEKTGSLSWLVLLFIGLRVWILMVAWSLAWIRRLYDCLKCRWFLYVMLWFTEFSIQDLSSLGGLLTFVDLSFLLGSWWCLSEASLRLGWGLKLGLEQSETRLQ